VIAGKRIITKEIEIAGKKMITKGPQSAGKRVIAIEVGIGTAVETAIGVGRCMDDTSAMKNNEATSAGVRKTTVRVVGGREAVLENLEDGGTTAMKR